MLDSWTSEGRMKVSFLCLFLAMKHTSTASAAFQQASNFNNRHPQLSASTNEEKGHHLKQSVAPRGRTRKWSHFQGAST